MSKDEGLRLHLGGEEVKTGWKIVNIQPKPGVDFIADCRDLSQFGDGTVTELYASHVYEHLAYNGELEPALKEAFCVLKKWGALRIAVPDGELLCKLYSTPGIHPEHRFSLMRMIMGGQTDAFDFHKSLFDYTMLESVLRHVGFSKVSRVKSFGLFKDTSDLDYHGIPISLNVVAIKEV